MLRVHRFRALLGVAAVVGVVGFVIHASAPAPTPGQYISWSAPAVPTASPGAGPPLPLASASPVTNAAPLGGLADAAVGTVQAVERQHRGHRDRGIRGGHRTSKPPSRPIFGSS